MNRAFLAVFALLSIAGCAADPTAPPPADPPAKTDLRPPTTEPEGNWQTEARWDLASRKLGKGTFKDGVYTITLPRADLEINHIEFGPLPVGAGLESRLFFWACECGKAMVVGQLCVADYELNDVLDELRAGNLKITGIAPLFNGDKPRVMALHFQGEGADDMLIPALRKALHWMGQSSKPLD